MSFDNVEVVHLCKCDNCSWTGPENHTSEPKDLWERLDPGSIVPSGDCPICKAFCYRIKEIEEEAFEVTCTLSVMADTPVTAEQRLQEELTYLIRLDNRVFAFEIDVTEPSFIEEKE